MKRSAALMAVAGLLIAGCSQADTVDGRATTSLEPSSTTEGSRGPTGELNPDTPITAEGLGPIKAGMTLAEVRDVAGELTLFGYEETGRYCWHATINRLEAPFELTFLAPGDAPAERPEDGELARVSAYGDTPSPPRTDKGVGIGSTKAEVLSAYESDAARAVEGCA